MIAYSILYKECDNNSVLLDLPWVQSCILYYGNLFYVKLYTVQEFMIGHAVARRGRLNYITSAHMHACANP